jgi:hypothetical protein
MAKRREGQQMAIDIWWYEDREQWCVDVPAGNGRKRLYLGANEPKARAELHRYMAAYYDRLEEDRAKAKKTWARNAEAPDPQQPALPRNLAQESGRGHSSLIR